MFKPLCSSVCRIVAEAVLWLQLPNNLGCAKKQFNDVLYLKNASESSWVRCLFSGIGAVITNHKDSCSYFVHKMLYCINEQTTLYTVKAFHPPNFNSFVRFFSLVWPTSHCARVKNEGSVNSTTVGWQWWWAWRPAQWELRLWNPSRTVIFAASSRRYCISEPPCLSELMFTQNQQKSTRPHLCSSSSDWGVELTFTFSVLTKLQMLIRLLIRVLVSRHLNIVDFCSRT